MSETLPTPAGDTPEPATPHDHALISKALSDEISLAREVANTASKIDYTAALAQEGIDAAFVTALFLKIKEAEDLAGGATGKTADRKIDTKSEADCKAALLLLVGKIQSRAKQKYDKRDDPAREKYYIGQHFSNSRSQTEAAANAIIVALSTDTLPGMQPGDVPALEQALADYEASQTVQKGDQSQATTWRARLEAKVHEVMAGRRKIQFAVDGIWPAVIPTNAGVRVEFKLSAHHALS